MYDWIIKLWIIDGHLYVYDVKKYIITLKGLNAPVDPLKYV